MKKAKMFLTAVAIIGIVGGAFAFKASKFGNASYFTCNTTTLQCTKSLESTYAALSTSESASFPNTITNARLSSSTQACTANSGCGTLYGSTTN